MLKYPYYKDNPKLKLITVKTVHGQTEYFSNCKKIGEDYYVKGIDLEYIDGTWVFRNQCIFDYETKKYVKNRHGLTHGIVSFNNNIPVMGYFSRNPYKNCFIRLRNGETWTFIDYNLLPLYYKEKYSEGVYYDTTGWSDDKIKILTRKTLSINNANHVYNVEDNIDFFQNAINLYNNSIIPIDKDIKYLSKYIKDITFGVELETINGTLPQHIMNKYGVMICKDGSLKDEDGRYPPEYVTVPLKGAKGLQTLRNISKEIAKRSDIDIKCSYHVHLGGMNIDRIFIVSLFNLCCKIQNDVFKMFPYYKTDPSGVKEKNYCKKLPGILSTFGTKNFNHYINQSYEDIYTFLSGGFKMDRRYNRKNRINPWGGEKWNIKTRYYWVNFINPLFGKRDTIEFRLHTPTLNSDKIINWLMMCAAMVKYAQANTLDCISNKKISFEDVLGVYGDVYKKSYAYHLSNRLIAYYNNRVNYFKNDFEKGDILSSEELYKDNDFEFNISKLNF